MYFTKTKTGKISRLQKYENICKNPILSSTRPIITPLYHLSSIDEPMIITAATINTSGLKGLSSMRTIQGKSIRPKVWLMKSELVTYSEMIFLSPVKYPSAKFTMVLKPNTTITNARKKKNWA